MKPERWANIEQLYHAALEHEPGARGAFLEAACASDDELRRQVAALLASDDQASGFIEAPALQVAAYALAANSHEPTYPAHVIPTIGAYQLLGPLGRGGMGEVFLARDQRLGRKVAIKLLPAEFTADADRVRRFAQEARAASGLNHPNIITIHEIGEVTTEAGSTHYIVTEYVEGETLRQMMSNAPQHRMSLAESLDVALQAAAALSAAHEAGIVHRDIKPENIMLRRDGIVKVLDFGLAKLTGQSKKSSDAEAPTRPLVQTNPGMVVGTVCYMSPEQSQGSPKVDHRTDVWSLGIVLYEMLAGCVPFEAKDVYRQIIAIQEQEPQPLSKLIEHLPEKLEEIIGKTLAKDCEERYQTAKDLLVDLRRLKKQIEVRKEIDRTTSPNKVQDESTTQPITTLPTSNAEYVTGEIRKHKLGFSVAALAVLLLAATGLGYWFFASRSSHLAQIESIAVLPFQNVSSNDDVEYLTDGMTESLINSLSQLPHLSVKARSTVFRYKDKQVEPLTIASELSVQAILSGRVVQRGDGLTVYLSLVDGRSGDQLWGEKYDRKMTDLVVLQNEITRDVSRKLRARLSGEDEQKLAKNYTENAEAYQLYLKGRYHLLKSTEAQTQAAISCFQQAIEIDQDYALAYAGLADAYRSLSNAGGMQAIAFQPKAKSAAQKAVALDDTLAQAHAILGFIIISHDWNWGAAENQFKRALELDPNNADAHLFYAHLLSHAGRHAEGLAEVKRAREIEPVNLRINALEGQFLIFAGRTDEAIARLQKTFELDANYWPSHSFAAYAYIEKGMFAEAVAEARKPSELNPASSQHKAILGYVLAKSGKQAEARVLLEELLKSSAERRPSPYFFALIYNGLDERDKALAWLERGYQQRDARMVFLKVHPSWNNLRADPRFQDLLRRIGFTQ